ncbi:MAG TPA: META domain-containing protein [Ornithinibacter sp.]|nr:META domain-containing protein [Ornithinibacter sp.]
MHRTTQISRSLAVVTLLAASLALGACGSESADLAGRSFTSTEVRGHDLVEGSAITLTFEDGRMSANGGCNTLNGAATWDGDTLDVAEPLASTMMACDEALMAQDQWLSEFLTSSPALEVDGDTMTLGDDTTGITLSES